MTKLLPPLFAAQIKIEKYQISNSTQPFFSQKKKNLFCDCPPSTTIQRPSSTIHHHPPSVTTNWRRTPGTPWLENWWLKHSTCKTKPSTCKTKILVISSGWGRYLKKFCKNSSRLVKKLLPPLFAAQIRIEKYQISNATQPFFFQKKRNILKQFLKQEKYPISFSEYSKRYVVYSLKGTKNNQEI